VRVLDQYLADLHAGQAPDRAKLLADHPELASRLNQCLAGIEFVHRASKPVSETPTQLGDFRILGELGRGGMGVVYEAEQVSLKRKVALKVLRFGPATDAEAMQRFQREAETVAGLHHTNIVPIFAVGCEQGVHYYAMQFIDGRSLADVFAETVQAAATLAPDKVARWGLQAAEALAHAHQRGVIHRDIKPSNLLLDKEGTVWLTDFGLAKRIDEVTMTLAGVVLGTPRYMSPEQADAAKHEIDHRTDIYSLGASLYELVTGRPVFVADTPQGVLTQILADEPVPPRQVRPSIPRDFETIVLKCLAKEPSQRYATAQELADDLRALVDGRAIKARRPRLAERAVRWARKQQRSVLVATLAASASVLLVLGTLFGRSWYLDAQLGYLVLRTDEPFITAEIVKDESDEVVRDGFSVPTQQPVTLPAGDYRVRLSAPGFVSETYRLLVDRGGRHDFQVGLGERRLWGPIDVHEDTLAVVDLAGHADLIQVNRQSLRRLNGANGQLLWEMTISGTEKSNLVRINGEDPLTLARPAPDLDGDGVRDLVWASRTSPSLWAVSGAGTADQKGKELWWFRAHPKLPEDLADTEGRWSPRFGKGRVVGQPVTADLEGVALDVDQDGTPDIVATFESRGEAFEVAEPRKQVITQPQKWIEAVSGKTGKSLWRYSLDTGWYRPPRNSSENPVFPAQVVRLGKDPVVVIAAGTRLVLLDARTGKPVREQELGFLAIQSPRFGDLDGDGVPDVLLLGEAKTRGNVLAAISLGTGRPLWEKATSVEYAPDRQVPKRLDWPLVVDLDNDGKAEVILPAGEGEGTSRWVGVEVLNGTDGSTRWQRRLRKQSEGPRLQQCDRFVAGPDLDGDGHRELFVASVAENIGNTSLFIGNTSLFIDALSGRDGRTLWWWSKRLLNFQDTVGALSWWPAGPDGWPQLLVPTAHWPSNPDAISVLSAGTGRLTHILPDAFDPQVADLDGDGIPDLYVRRGGDVHFQGGKIDFLRGGLPEAWRRLGIWEAAQDFDGDGITDLVNFHNGRITAVSGRDGRKLWQANGEDQAAPYIASLKSSNSPVRGIVGKGIVVPPLPLGDLDGDGTPDLLVLPIGGQGRLDKDYERVVLPVRALSGRTGELLWRAEDVPAPGVDHHQIVFAEPHVPQCQDLYGDGRREVIVPFFVRFSGLEQLWLAVISGKDGKLLWNKLLSERKLEGPSQLSQSYRTQPVFADLDGDGVLDVLVAVPASILKDGTVTVDLQALSGRDGRLLWQQQVVGTEPRRFILEHMPVPVVGDLDGDGKPEVIIADSLDGPPAGPPLVHLTVLALNGQDGRVRWTWRSDESHAGPSQLVKPLLVNLDGDGRRGVAVYGPASAKNGMSELILLDAQGNVHQRRTVLPGLGPFQLARLWSWDVDGDGRDELLFARQEVGKAIVQATRDGFEKVVWEWQMPGGVGDILDIHADRTTRAPVVVVASLNTVYGLDGKIGKPLWSGQGLPSVASGTGKTGIPGFGGMLLHANDPQGLPRVVGWAKEATVCRLTQPMPPAESRPIVPAVCVPALDDPRMVRQLPWRHWEQLPRIVWLGQPSFVVVLLISGLLVRRAVRRRSWKLSLLPAACLAAYLMGSVIGLRYPVKDANTETLAQDLLVVTVLAAVSLLPLAFLNSLVRWLMGGRWLRGGLLLASSVAFCLLFAAVWLWQDGRALEPEQHYSRQGWYAIWPVGVYATGLVILVVYLLGLLVRSIRWGVTRVFWRRRLMGVQ
jgi:outer membrane protein assembly factor BamB/predicted Ser/Thr protein kinase